ncbi:MAG: PAS domain S-box protein [Desulfobacterales bacterium]|nr:PAS domain S-box protein [Desulfobacterales bacterium]
MTDTLTYEELEYRVRILENEARWRKQAEQALQESEKRFKLLFEYAPDMFFICDESGVLIDANRAAEKLTGYERHEVVGKSLLSLGILPKNQTQKAAELLYKISRKIPTDPEEITIIRKDGQSINVELRSYPVDLGGRPLVLSTARDIDIHKQTIELIKKREEKYRKSFESAPAPFVLINAATAEIEDANHDARALMGYSREELQKSNLQDLLTDLENAPLHLPDLLNEKPDGPNFFFCSFKTKHKGIKEGTFLFSRFKSDDQNLIVGRISTKDNADR